MKFAAIIEYAEDKALLKANHPVHRAYLRTFLENGDEAIFRARASRDGYVSIGFGECRGRVI